jgi:chromosome segregation ATPase
MKRQIPIVAADFEYELTKNYANIDCLIDQTADIKGEIICLEEELKAEKLRGTLIGQKIEANEQYVDQLEDRVQQLETHQNECIEDGDNIHSQMREEMNNQLATETELYNNST